MKYQLTSSLELPYPRPQVFEFFADPANLGRITPPGMHFRMVTPVPFAMRGGAVIDYRIRVFGLPMRWRSLIDRWEPPCEFVDAQLKGPYKSWVHTHRFSDCQRGTLVEDLVEYELPLGPLQGLLRRPIARQLDEIFAYRRTAIEEILRHTLGGNGDLPAT